MDKRPNHFAGSPNPESGVRHTITIGAGPFAGIKGTVIKSSARRMRVAIQGPEGTLVIDLDCSKVIATDPASRPTSRNEGVQQQVSKTG